MTKTMADDESRITYDRNEGEEDDLISYKNEVRHASV
jgi:hypothetical protein